MPQPRTESFMTVVEDFATPEEVERIYNHMVENSQDDPRDNYRFYGVAGPEILDDVTYPWDPTGVLSRVANYVNDFFIDRYGFGDEFVLNRVHGNIMEVGAALHTHKDEAYASNTKDSVQNQDHVYDKKTYACSFFLNDDYEGGEFVFYDQDQVLKPKPGTLVIFAGHGTTHEVREVTKGARVNVLFMFYEWL